MTDKRWKQIEKHVKNDLDGVESEFPLGDEQLQDLVRELFRYASKLRAEEKLRLAAYEIGRDGIKEQQKC